MSLIYDVGVEASSCGYCNPKGKDGDIEGKGGDENNRLKSSVNHYLLAKLILPKDYQFLLDTGWRRGGDLLYRPVRGMTCCPLESIRTNCNTIQLHKYQRKTIRKFANATGLVLPPIEDRGEFLAAFARASCSGGDRFSLVLENDDFDPVSYSIYCKYQKEIHGEDVEKGSGVEGFIRFLCSSPIKRTAVKEANDKDPLAFCLDQYGSYHLKYKLDDKIVAVSVIDILPNCISSVYFLYDPDYSNLSLGTVSALLEIGLLRLLGKSIPDFHYYYLGYYLSSCPKLAYKANFEPFEILDLKSMGWK